MSAAHPSQREMAEAFARRDASYDGLFYVAVTTTGIFCRPSCPARRPLEENTQYYHQAREALFAGFRPCKRCRPLEAGANVPSWLAPLIEKVESNPTIRMKDSDLSVLGVSPSRVRRHFNERYGMTFQAYCRARRLGRAFEQLRTGAAIDDAVYGHGYNSHSGFRDAFFKRFGAPPGEARTGDFIHVTWIETALGPMVAGAVDKGVCLLEFSDRRMMEAQIETLSRRFNLPLAPGENTHLAHLRRELDAYFTGTLRSFSVPIVYPGTPFQERVWKALLAIPYGETRTYEDIARAIGSPRGVRAVGHANGLNRIGIVIPCHRVVNKNGELGGYGGGLWRKRKLLEIEQGMRDVRDMARPDGM
jgi:AraC family transcriptional regulator, regulatory protein of adaptative response / methylated-DNA-[protein]-cysteine methyltransferase